MVRQIGSSYGAGPDVLGRCLQRMAGWVSLAVRTVETEFPSFDSIASFSVFNVSELSQEPADACTRAVARDLHLH